MSPAHWRPHCQKSQWDQSGTKVKQIGAASPTLLWASGVKGNLMGDVNNCTLVLCCCKINGHKFRSVNQHPFITSQFSRSEVQENCTGFSTQGASKLKTQGSARLGSSLEAQEKNLLPNVVEWLVELISCGCTTEIPICLLTVSWGYSRLSCLHALACGTSKPVTVC